MTGIFISYRRHDTAGHAGRLSDGLSARFGKATVFMDLEAIMPGVDYEDRIREAIGSSAVALVLIGDQWLTMTSADGRRRIDDPKDFVRLEVASALARDDLDVVPVLVEGAQMPAPDELPDDISRLARINAIELTDQRWQYDLGRLVEAIGPALGEIAHERSSRPAWWKIAAPVVGLAVAAAVVLAASGAFSGSKHGPPKPAGACPPVGLKQQQGPPNLDQLNALQTAIVPGRSLGSVSLGQTAGQVEEELKFLGAGRMVAGNPCRGLGQLTWTLSSGGQGLGVHFDAAGKADQILDTSGLFRLGNASLNATIDGLQRDLGPSWKRLACQGFSVLYRNESDSGPSTIWRLGAKQGNLELRSFSFPGDNAPCGTP